MSADRRRVETGQARLPRHQVELDAFALARYPTTNAMFRVSWRPAAMPTSAGGPRPGRPAPGCLRARSRIWFGDVRDRPAYWDDDRFNGPNQPVVGVTWYEAAAYCRWLTAVLDDGHDLPPAHRGRVGAGRQGAGGPPLPLGRRMAGGQGQHRGAEPGSARRRWASFPTAPAPRACWILAGNVWEWCQDWYAEDTYRLSADAVARNPRGAASGRYKVLRGGSWYSDASSVRCASRDRLLPGLQVRLPTGFASPGVPSDRHPVSCILCSVPCPLSPRPCWEVWGACSPGRSELAVCEVKSMARTFKGLYPKIYDFDNLWLAWRRARRGGKRKWPTVAAFEVDLEQNLLGATRGAARKDLPARPLPPFHHPRAQDAAHLGRALPRPGGPPRPDAGHLAHLRSAHDPRQLCLPRGQGRPHNRNNNNGFRVASSRREDGQGNAGGDQQSLTSGQRHPF